MLLQLLQHSSNGFHVLLTFAFCVDEDVTKVHYYENIKLLCWDLVDITLEGSWYVGQSKKYHLVLEMAIMGPEDYFLFVAFFNPHQMIGISQSKLGEISNPI